MNEWRVNFRAKILQRDGSRCIVCHKGIGDGLSLDAHHLLERRLFSDGGYDPDNGVTLCSVCHLKAEKTLISPAELRRLAGIRRVVLPPGFFPLYEYDKWGNRLAQDGGRFPGPLFLQPAVQRLLREAGVLHLFNSAPLTAREVISLIQRNQLRWLANNKDCLFYQQEQEDEEFRG